MKKLASTHSPLIKKIHHVSLLHHVMRIEMNTNWDSESSSFSTVNIKHPDEGTRREIIEQGATSRTFQSSLERKRTSEHSFAFGLLY